MQIIQHTEIWHDTPTLFSVAEVAETIGVDLMSALTLKTNID